MQNWDQYEKFMFEEINDQIKTDPVTDWGKGMSILLVSDNAPGRTEALRNYPKTKTQVSSVPICSDIESAKENTALKTPDAIVFVAMQQKSGNYEIVQLIKNTNSKIFICLYDHIDFISKNVCYTNGIKEYFSDKQPVSEFIKYLKTMIARTKN